jgi:putative transcriptional regulator
MIKINIKQILKSRDKSIYWLTDKTSLSYTTVYNLANNKTLSIHFNTLEEIMKALDITSFDDILEITSE